MKDEDVRLYIRDNIIYSNKDHTIEVGIISNDGKQINLWNNYGKETRCIFCGNVITEDNGGSIEFVGINKLDRRKFEKINEFDQKLNNICSPCVLGIYRMMWSEFKNSKLTKKYDNEAAARGRNK